MAKLTFTTNGKKARRHFSKKLLALCAVVLVVGIVAVLELTNTTHFFHKPPSEVIVKAGKPTATVKNNSSAHQTPVKKSPSNNSNVHVVSGGSDTNGASNASTSPSQWVVSRSGDITVKQPIANATFHSGDTLSGSAKVGVISFRLIDDNVGVISQGTLNVVNGNFSGTLNFTSQASTGRLDVFSTNDQGVELNEVQISVRF